MLLGSALLLDLRRAEPDAGRASGLRERIGGLRFRRRAKPPPLERATLRFSVNKPDRAEQKRPVAEALGAAAATRQWRRSTASPRNSS